MKKRVIRELKTLGPALLFASISTSVFMSLLLGPYAIYLFIVLVFISAINLPVLTFAIALLDTTAIRIVVFITSPVANFFLFMPARSKDLANYSDGNYPPEVFMFFLFVTTAGVSYLWLLRAGRDKIIPQALQYRNK